MCFFALLLYSSFTIAVMAESHPGRREYLVWEQCYMIRHCQGHWRPCDLVEIEWTHVLSPILSLVWGKDIGQFRIEIGKSGHFGIFL